MRALPAVLAALLLCAAPAQAAPTWLPPTDLTAGLQGERPAADVAVARDGTAVAVWSRSGDDGPVVEAARRRPGQGWSAPIPVTAPGEHGRTPQVAIDAQDNATVVWVADPDGPVRAARLPVAPDAVGPADTLSSGAQPRTPAIAVGPDGTAIVVFAEGASGGRVLKAAFRAPGAAGFGDAATVSGSFQSFYNPTGTRPAAEIGIDAAGGAVIAWAGFDGTRYIVQTNDRAGGGSFASNGQTRSSTEGRASGTDPALAVDPAGGATVAWTHDQDAANAGDATEVRWSERLPGQDFAAPAPVDAQVPTAAPSLAAGADGTVVGAWVLGSGDERRVQLAVKPRGQAFADYREVSPPGPLVLPAVHGDAAGDALVTWVGSSDEGVFSVRRSRSGAVGAVQQAASRTAATPSRDFTAPAVALDDQGNGTAVWVATDHTDAGDVFHVQAGGHDAAAPTVIGIQIAGTPRAGTPAPMSVAATDRWSPVSYAWSFGDDTFAAGASVRHVWRRAGPFTVAGTATDAVGNAAVGAQQVLVGPAPVRRVRTPVRVLWRPDPARGLVVLARLQVRRPPRGTVVRLRCAGARCPVRVRRVSRARRGVIDVAAALRPRERRFAPGQTVTLRITARGRIGKVLRYRLRAAAPPRVRRLCLPVGATRPQARCARRRSADRGTRRAPRPASAVADARNGRAGRATTRPR